jgi:O-acetyl-ADP-ribose deacetylase (regulator of RNase III)
MERSNPASLGFLHANSRDADPRSHQKASSLTFCTDTTLLAMHTTVDGVTIELTQGDIAAQDDVQAVVNAANAQLQMGGGVAGAIHTAAGPGLADETRPLAPIEPGEAVITGGHNLPNAYVIHVLGPVYGRDQPSDALRRAGYENALALAEQNDIQRVAFPALSTGAFGYPMDPAARIALRTMLNAAPTLEAIDHIRFVLYDRQALRVHEDVLEEVLSDVE